MTEPITLRLAAVDIQNLERIARSLRHDLLRPSLTRSEVIRAAIRVAAAQSPDPGGTV